MNPATHPARVLVVDDEDRNRRLLVTMLEAEGHVALEAGDGPQALEQARRSHPDLILLDVMMPGMDGFSVARTLKADPATRAIPIVMVTALDDRASRLGGLEAGAEEFVCKPVDRIELQARLRNLLRLKGLMGELEQARDEAEAASRAKSAFLSSMSHEIRTPLNAVLGFSELLLQEQGLSARQQDYLQIINRAGDHLLGLINEVLELARIEAGRASLALEPLDLPRLIKELAALFRVKAEDKGLNLACHVDPQVPSFVLADANKLRQILMNLLGNAIKFTEAGGVSLEVRAMGSPGEAWPLRFEVKDTGPGIDPEGLERIFTAFEQTASGAAKGGAGLGLAISRQYARLMGGDLEGASEPGRGSCFSLNLTLPPAEFAAPGRPLPTPLQWLSPGQAECRVLIVDDEENNRALLREMLGGAGFVTREAVDGVGALALYESWMPHAVLMDLQMPTLNGLEGIRRIKATERGRNTWIFALSASALDFNQQDALAAGADGFIPKPFRLAQLLDPLGKALGLKFEPRPLSGGPTPVLAHLNGAPRVLPDWPSRLRRAAQQARYDELLNLISALALEEPGRAALLRERAEQFDYEGLMAYVDSEEVSHE
jgi:signal transduction histidine kinase